jgi:hypothetical protein
VLCLDESWAAERTNEMQAVERSSARSPCCRWSKAPLSTGGRSGAARTASGTAPLFTHLHFTPTESSWLNQVERFFALLTARRLKRGVQRSVEDLEAEVLASIERHNAEPKPFRCTKPADQILASVARSCQRILAAPGAILTLNSDTQH